MPVGAPITDFVTTRKNEYRDAGVLFFFSIPSTAPTTSQTVITIILAPSTRTAGKIEGLRPLVFARYPLAK